MTLYDSTSGQLAAWVQTPLLAPGTVLYMYYGNPNAASQQNPAAVWDSNYQAVWHLKSAASADSTTASDSTAFGTNSGAFSGSISATGKIGGGVIPNVDVS